jgi:uncharacterized phage-associated protein
MRELQYEKFVNAVLYLLESCPARPGVVGLVKLLFFTDYFHYRDHLSSVTDAQYVAMPNGPVVDDYKLLFERMKADGYIDEDRVPVPGAGNAKVQYVPKRRAAADAFSDSELKVLGHVARRYGHLTGKALIEMSHRVGPWALVWDPSEPNKRIPYSVFRWLDNLPDDEDLAKAKKALSRPNVVRELAALS